MRFPTQNHTGNQALALLRNGGQPTASLFINSKPNPHTAHSTAMAHLVVGGDVGGTNSRLALYTIPASKLALIEGRTPPGTVVYSKWYRNSEHVTFTDVFKTFLQEAADAGAAVKEISTACLAVAGPVSNNEVTMTNRGRWVINGEKLAKELGMKRVQLINDFVALGYGLLTVDRTNVKEVRVLQDAPVQAGAPIATIGAGTGLGECFLTPGEGGHYVAYPSEGGHAEFPPRTETEFQLLEFLKRRYEQKHRVSVERVVSGPGIANVYDFLAEHYPDQVDKSVDAAFRAAGELGGKVVSENAKAGTLAGMALDIFAGAYGSEAGVAGLKWMPFGGLFITGGLTPKNIDRIAGKDSLFMAAFRDKGRVSPFLSKIPLYAVLVEDLGERGAQWVAIKVLLEHLNKGNSHRGAFKGSSSSGASSNGIPFWCTHTAVAMLGGALLATLSVLAVKAKK